MDDNSNLPPSDGSDFATLDSLAQELRIGIGMAEGEVQRLMGSVFASPQTAERGLRKLISRGGLEHALAVLERDSFARSWHFGRLQIGLIPWRRRTVNAALAELPDALRRLQHLNDRQRDLQLARRTALRRGPPVMPDDDPSPSRPRGRKRGR